MFLDVEELIKNAVEINGNKVTYQIPVKIISTVRC